MKKLTPYLLIAPHVILLLILLTGFVNALIQSLGYIPALGLHSISLEYYGHMLNNSDFIDSLLLSLYISFVSSALSAIFGITICAVLVYCGKMKGLLYQIVRVPILVPHTVVALFVSLLLSQSGILSRIVYHMGFIGTPVDFPNLLYNESSAGILLGYVWKQAPFVALFTLSLMESVNKTLEEAAINLGVSPFKAFFGVTLPLSMPAVADALLVITAFSFGSYELPFLLGITKPKALPVQAYIEYTHPDLTHRPYAMAANGILIIVSTIIALLYFTLAKKKWGSMKRNYDN